MSDDVQVELVDDDPRPTKRGETTDRLLFRVVVGGEIKALVASGITYTLLGQRGDLDTVGRQMAFIKDHAPEVIRVNYMLEQLGGYEQLDSETVAVDLEEGNVPPR